MLVMSDSRITSRRDFLRFTAAGIAVVGWQQFYEVRGAFAEELTRTPEQMEGPFYPDRLPLDTDNDLIVVNDGLTPAVGDVTWLGGRMLTASGTPIRNATVEIWQCDASGVYLHTWTGGDKARRDANFQGFGRFV